MRSAADRSDVGQPRGAKRKNQMTRSRTKQHRTAH